MGWLGQNRNGLFVHFTLTGSDREKDWTGELWRTRQNRIIKLILFFVWTVEVGRKVVWSCFPTVTGSHGWLAFHVYLFIIVPSYSCWAKALINSVQYRKFSTKLCQVITTLLMETITLWIWLWWVSMIETISISLY